MSRLVNPVIPTRILLIEDSNTDALLIQAHLKKADPSFVVKRELNLADGLAHVSRGETDVILLDLNLPDSAGLETFSALYRRALQVPIVVLSGQDDVELAVDAVSLGAQDYLPKGEANRSSLARSVRYAIERARRQRAEQELTAAGEIQRRLFPQRSPHLDGYDLYGRCEPANSAGGDYFDYFPMDDGRWGIVVADVAGHGIGPALIMSETRAILRSLATTHNDPGQILTRANQVLTEDLHNNIFVALLLACLEPATAELQFASAGHPGLLLDPSGAVAQKFLSADPPLGVL
ncbi:MAG: response regulator, partial [Planctomycetales bacterium]|nr:response regulator [Planctomycetales bacterium]